MGLGRIWGPCPFGLPERLNVAQDKGTRILETMVSEIPSSRAFEPECRILMFILRHTVLYCSIRYKNIQD